MELLFIALSSFLIALSGAMMPGPLLTATIGEALARGPWVGPLLMVGHGLLELALVVALCLGLAPLFTGSGVVGAVSVVGSVVLLWLAYGMFRSLPTLSLAVETPHLSQGRGRNMVMTGILLSLANPYWLVWWATIGLNYVLASRRWGVVGVGAFFLGHITADLAFYTSVSLGVHRGRSLMGDRLYRGIIAACAGALACFGVLFLIHGLGQLRGAGLWA